MTRADQLPEDLEAERALLSTLCAPGNEAVAGVLAFSLPEEAFNHPGHRCVWAALRALLREGQEVSTIALKAALEQAGSLGKVGGFNGLVEMLEAEEVGRPQVLVDLLRRKWNARRLIRMGATLARDAQTEERTPESLVMQLMTEGAGLLMDGKRGRWEAAGDGILEALQTTGYLTENPQSPKGCTLRLGLPTLDAALKRLAGNLVVIAARPKCGKCFGLGTPVLMHDGTIKPVEQVREGDLLMGPDSQPRRAMGITTGREMLYRIDLRNGDSFVCNESHVLSLRANADLPGHAKGSVINIPISEYLAKGPKFRHNTKAYKSDTLHFQPPSPLSIPPYILGLWLGDGTTKGTGITNPDPEIVSAWTEYASSIGHHITTVDDGFRCPTYNIVRERGAGNRFLDALRSYGVFESKTIPRDYLMASESDRLDLLAGMLDTDGHWNGKSYEWSTVKPEMAQAFEFLCRSLGFACKVRPIRKTCCNTGAVGTYWAGCVSGSTHRIPCRVPRKSAKDKVVSKNVLNLAFTVTPIGEGDYYGFEVDGDHLFLLGDFTVVHNTTQAVKSAFAMAKAGHHVAFATLEMTAKELYVVLLAHALGITQDQAARGELTPMDWSLFMDLKETLDRIHIYPFDPDTAWPMVEACLRQAITTWNCSCCYLDYFGLVGKPEGEFFSEAARSAALSRRMKALPKQTGCIFVVLVQINRDLGDAGEPGPSNIRDTGQLEQDMAVGIFLWREPCKDPVAVQRGQRWEYFAKIDYNRFGPSYLKTGITLDGAHAQIHEVERTTDQRPDPAARRSRATQAPLNL